MLSQRRPRKLLLHKREAIKLIGAVHKEGMTPNPVECFSKGPLTPALSREGRGGRPCPLSGRTPLPSRERGQE